MKMQEFPQLLDEMYQYADDVEPYHKTSTTTPSALFCCLLRLFTMGIDSRQLKQLLETADNPYVRFGLPPDQLWGWLGEYTLDSEEFNPSKDVTGVTMTIGEFVETLLSQDKYSSVLLPRLPGGMKRSLQEKLAPI